MLREPPQPAPNVDGYRKASSGRFVGFDLVDPGLTRSDDGRLQNARDEQQLSRRELRARYGHHNTGERNANRMSEPDRTTSDRPTTTEAADRGVSPEPDRGFERVETAGVTVGGFEDDQMRGEGRAPAGGALQGTTPQTVVDNFATGREADIAFVSAEEDRAPSTTQQFGEAIADEVDRATYGSDHGGGSSGGDGFLQQPDAVAEGDDPYLVGNAGSFNSPYKSKDEEEKYS